MISYTPNDDEANVAFLIAKRRNTLNGGRWVSNLTREKESTVSINERLISQYCAALSEITVSRILNMCWTGCGKGACGAEDVGGCIEVRSIVKRGLGLISRKKDENKICVLVHVDKGTRLCTILGWSSHAYVKKNGVPRDQNTEKPYWVLPEDQLFPIETLMERAESSPAEFVECAKILVGE